MLSQKKTNCYFLTHHTWKMSPHDFVKCTNFSSFSSFHMYRNNPRYGRVAKASCCDMGWISAEHGGWCSWSVAKKTGSMYPCRKWSLWTFAVTLLAWHSICHTSQLVLFRATNANLQPAFLQSHRWLDFGGMKHPCSQMKTSCILQGSAVTFFRCGEKSSSSVEAEVLDALIVFSSCVMCDNDASSF